MAAVRLLGDWESKGQLELWAAWSINRLHVKYRALVFLRCTHHSCPHLL